MSESFPDGMMDDITHFFKDVHPRLEPGKGVYDEVFQTNLFFPLQRKNELSYMLTLATSKTKELRVVMEIGADKGGGLYHWCMTPTVRVVIACEIKGTPYSYLFENEFPDIEFLWLPQSSQLTDTVVRTQRFLSKRYSSIDCLFIDGDKGQTTNDWNVYSRMMLPDRLMDDKGNMEERGSICFIHDVNEEGHPRDTYFNIRSQGYGGEMVIRTSESEEACYREQVGIPPTNPHEAWLRHWRGRSCGVGVIYK